MSYVTVSRIKESSNGHDMTNVSSFSNGNDDYK